MAFFSMFFSVTLTLSHLCLHNYSGYIYTRYKSNSGVRLCLVQCLSGDRLQNGSSVSTCRRRCLNFHCQVVGRQENKRVIKSLHNHSRPIMQSCDIFVDIIQLTIVLFRVRYYQAFKEVYVSINCIGYETDQMAFLLFLASGDRKLSRLIMQSPGFARDIRKNVIERWDLGLMHYIDILAMYCRVISPSFLFLQFQLCDTRIVDLTRRCKPLVFAFYIQLITRLLTHPTQDVITYASCLLKIGDSQLHTTCVEELLPSCHATVWVPRPPSE